MYWKKNKYVPSNSVYVVPAWNFFFSTTTPNEYVELKWEINSNVNKSDSSNKVEISTDTILPCKIEVFLFRYIDKPLTIITLIIGIILYK